MSKNQEVEKATSLTPISKLILAWVYLFPASVLTFVSLFLLKTGEDPTGFFLSNAFITLLLVLTPLIIAVCNWATKILLKVNQSAKTMAYISVGIVTVLFVTAATYYLYYKFATPVIRFADLEQTLMVGFIASSLLASLIYSSHYFKIVHSFGLKPKQKIMYWLISLTFPLLLALTALIYF